jgi:hypothetical protein
MIRLFRYYTYLLSEVTTWTALFLKLFNFVQRDLLTLKIVKYSTAFLTVIEKGTPIYFVL